MTLKYFNIKDDPKMAGVDQNLMFMLDNARQFAGIPFFITSGLRTPAESIACGGFATDPHTLGLAVDIECLNDEQAYCITAGALASGFKRIGRGAGHIHLDTVPNLPQKVYWIEKGAI